MDRIFVPSLVAGQLETVVMKMMSVQVCSASTGYAETLSVSRLSTVSWWTCSRHDSTHPTELAMMSTHSTDATEEYHTDKRKQVGHRAAVPLLACTTVGSGSDQQSITYCQHTVEPFW